MCGGAGNDRITGGTGADRLAGGLGADVFVDQRMAASGRRGEGVITFFTILTSPPGHIDQIDRSVTAAQAGRAFANTYVFAGSFAGSAEFTAIGQVRAVQVSADACVESNVVTNLATDLRMCRTGFATSTLRAADFML